MLIKHFYLFNSYHCPVLNALTPFIIHLRLIKYILSNNRRVNTQWTDDRVRDINTETNSIKKNMRISN